MNAVLQEKLWDRILPEPNSGCWLWDGGVSRTGYGFVYLGGGRANYAQVSVHRLVYEQLVGPISEGLVIDHKCRTRRCCNPDHLEAVPQRVNVLRGDAPVLAAARQLAKTHCPQGHPYAGANLGVRKNGDRYCLECARKRDREAKRQQRAARRANLPQDMRLSEK
jgi:hypothetical protein